jgi:hypothetical protein
MKFKLDECMDVRLVRLFADAGHAAQTVYVEGFEGCWRERFLMLDSGHWILEKSRARNA